MVKSSGGKAWVHHQAGVLVISPVTKLCVSCCTLHHSPLIFSSCLENRTVPLTTRPEDPVFPSLASFFDVPQDKEACRVEGEGGYPAYEVQEGIISEHPRLLQQHREREGRSPAAGLPPAPKETGRKASQKVTTMKSSWRVSSPD